MGAEGVILLVRDVCCYLDGDLGQRELVCVAVFDQYMAFEANGAYACHSCVPVQVIVEL